MELRPVRAGAKEMEFSVSGKNVPFTLSFVIPIPATGTTQITVRSRNRQKEVGEIKKSLDALNLLRPAGELHIIDLETEKPFVIAKVELGNESPEQAAYREFVNDLVVISDRFGVKLKVPEKLVRKDYETIGLLKRYIDNGTEEVDNISLVLTKTAENKDSLPELFASGKGMFAITHLRLDPPPTLFGTAIDTGPVMMAAEAEIKDLTSVLQSFREAAIGSGVRVSLRPLTPLRFSLMPRAA
jgi:hypothetical protein